MGVLAACGPQRLEHGVLQANASVVRTVDGDTVDVNIDGVDERVRLIGIDTPESVDPRRPVECFGKEASAYLATVIPNGTSVRVVLDAEPRDRYDRLLAYVYRASDGEFVNLAMIRDGYANTLTISPNVTHRDVFAAAERDARTKGLGLWSACDA